MSVLAYQTIPPRPGYRANTQSRANVYEEREYKKGTYEPPIKSEDSITADHQLPLLPLLLPLKENIENNTV